MNFRVKYLIPVIAWLITAEISAAEFSVPKPYPTAFEKYVGHRYARVQGVDEPRKISGTGGWIEFQAISAFNEVAHPQSMDGLKIEVRYPTRQDRVYLSRDSATALHARLVNLGISAPKMASEPAHVTHGTADCRPGLSDRRLHQLCVGIYRRADEVGVVVSTLAYEHLYLPGVDLQHLIDAIGDELRVIQPSAR